MRVVADVIPATILPKSARIVGCRASGRVWPHIVMTTEQSDAELVAALVGGQSSALAMIYDRYSASLYDTARAMLRDPEDAADVMQDVFIVTADRIGQLRDPDRLKPWLFAILRNEVYRRT